MKKFLAILLSLAMIFSLGMMTGCGSSGGDEAADGAEGGDAAAEPVVLHFGSTQGSTHAWYEAALVLKDALTEYSNGSIDLQIDFGGVWGGDTDHAEGVQNGTIDMYIGSTVGFDTIVTSMGFVNLPYLVTTYDQVERLIYNGWLGEEIAAQGEAVGLKVIGLTDCDFRWISNSKRPIESAADMKGMKMRTPPTQMFLTFFEELGAIPGSNQFTELPSTLQQGVYDGQDNGPTLSYPNGLHQFNQYWTKSNHSFASAVVAINPARWESLSADQQAALQQGIDEYCEMIKTLLREDVSEMTQGMIDDGCEVIEATEQLQKDMQEAGLAVWFNDEATGNFDTDCMAKIRELGGAE